MNAERKTPIRTCVSCRTSSAKKDLTRIVRTTDGQVRLDFTGKLPGRGAYICGAKECLAAAIKHNRLGRALRCAIPPVLVDELQARAVDENEQNERFDDGNWDYASIVSSG